MDVTEALRARRSIRRYKKAEIPQKHIDIILEAAMMCPSASNRRAYEFAVVKTADLLEKLSSACPRWFMVREASLAIVVLGRPDLEEGMGHEFWQQDCSAATENILLQSPELGYGTCWCGVYPIEERIAAIRKILKVSEKCVPFSLIAIGVADETPPAKGFYDKSRVTYY